MMAMLLTAMAGTVAYGFAPFTLFNWYHIYEPVQLYRNLEFAVFSAIALYGLAEFAVALRDTANRLLQPFQRKGSRVKLPSLHTS
ncbi:MAG: hypothetical protein ACE5IG_06050 [Dehalococcoidia bacterium]